jgi:hypothetical protein
MALMVGALREALAAAGATEAQARAAAEEVAAYENRLVGIEQRLVELRGYVDQRFTPLYWMIATVLAFEIAIFVKLFIH